MSVLIWERKRYDDGQATTVDEHFANETQLAMLVELGLGQSYVVPHRSISRLNPETAEPDESIQHWLLVEDWRNRRALWIKPDGEVEQAKTPYPWCIGNSYRANCVANGFCRRSTSCGN